MLTAEDVVLCPDPDWDSNSTSMMEQFGDLIPGALRGRFRPGRAEGAADPLVLRRSSAR